MKCSQRVTVISLSVACGVAGVFFCLGRLCNSNKGPTQKARKLYKIKRDTHKESEDVEELELNVRRKFQVAKGGATDHSGECVMAYVSDFDMDKTLFAELRPWSKIVVKGRTAIDSWWSDEAVSRCTVLYSKIPPTPKIENHLIKFMKEECDFALEHADGSFLDHLKFCYDYNIVHYKSQSPIPLLLHSIMGVGTNFFPLRLDQVPKLQELVSPEDFKQIEIFPSVVRLLYGSDFLTDLINDPRPLSEIESITVHRVLDNKAIQMSGKDLRVQLNLQIIHLLDFLPCCSWLSQIDDTFLKTMCDMYVCMTKSNGSILDANVDFDITSGEHTTDGIPVSVGSILSGLIPSTILTGLKKAEMRRYSRKIGHCLDYTLEWN